MSRETHTDLIGLSDRELRMRAGDATHQHYKGGLYRLLGDAMDARTGGALLDLDGRPMVVYEHVYPRRRELWLRSSREFYGTVEVEGERRERFRRLG